MSEKGWTDYDQLMNYFVLKADEIARNSIKEQQTSQQPRIIHWEEVFSAGV